ncbi:uncharacterized protein LOC142175435 [Nicotiana tabacum]|uniref:Uncharacterized protein LOC142175435 n=1 Tax=Nicotiana tabacum TaxID=4097 RepID=A0AC58TM63_TOBAC
MNTEQNEPFSALSEVPLQLHMWWNDLEADSKGVIGRILGGFVNLLGVEPRTDILEALIPFWDPTCNVFRFVDFELSPTLEEVAGYAGLNERLRGQYLLSPRPVSPHAFLDLLSISRKVQHDDLSRGCCDLHFLYQRYGTPQGFEEPNLGLTHGGNRNKWEARRILAFITAFLGVMVCPRKDKKIEIGLVGMADVAIKRTNSTVVPLILSEIYRALTICREGGKFFQGCNLLLQLWMQEHLHHRVGYMNHGLTERSCISGFKKRMTGARFPEGVEEWFTRLRSTTSDQIEWAFGWLTDTEVIYMSAEECHVLLMGLRSIQPYAHHRVLRQLGRFQVVPNDENLSKHALELSPGVIFPEGKIRKLWHECRFLEPKTMVRELAKGEVDPKYGAWFERRFQTRRRPAKRAHVQHFTNDSQEQWGWLKREKGYRVEIGKLKQQVERLVFENNVQVASEQAERNKLAQENQTLKARLRQASKSNVDRQKRRSDERLIASLRNQVIQGQEELEQSRACITRMKVRGAKYAMARKQHLQQVIRDYEISVRILRETSSTLHDRIVKQARDAQADRRQCYDAMDCMERQMELFQDQLADNAQALRLKNQQIRQLLSERDDIRARIDEIGHYIYMKCLACEQTPRKTLLVSIMGCVRRIMNELKNLQRDLTPRAAERPNDVSRALKWEN